MNKEMTQLNITLDQEEILALLSKNHDGAFRKLLQACLNKVLFGRVRRTARRSTL